jgi:hypothetical protein
VLRHATGFYLANAGQDARAIQLYPGHKSIQRTVRCTELAETDSRTSGKISLVKPGGWEAAVDHVRSAIQQDQETNQAMTVVLIAIVTV